MESSPSDSKVSCVLCEKSLDVHRKSGTLITGSGTMCVGCGDEYREEQTRLEKDAARRVKRELQRWVQKMKSVKRFDKRQQRLPLDGGDQ
jgi:hypothetical protein